jgi:hypothetical protein
MSRTIGVNGGKDSYLQALVAELQERIHELALLQKGGGCDDETIREYEQGINDQRDEIKMYKQEKGIPNTDDVKASLEVTDKNSKKVDSNSPIKVVQDVIADLELKFLKGHKAGWDEKILTKIHKAIMNKKMELADLETQEEEASDDFKKNKEISQLEEDLAHLYEERAQIEQVIAAKEDKLRQLKPYASEDDKLNKVGQVDNFDDDLDRLWGGAVDRHKKYKEMYGSDPSEGVMMAKVTNPALFS